mgnify:CR=1 FL=1|tara:strand:+ start:3073 stop:3312 length:240 start_codon:yes stop_codon:yes gene_type:complete
MSNYIVNPASRLYRNLKVEEGEDTDVKATRGLLARTQPTKARGKMGVSNPSERVAKHVSILRRKRQEIKQDDRTEQTTI